MVCSNGISSSLSHLSIGVPQGTILGPTLFVVYVNDFSYNISPITTIRYADDTSLIAWGKDITEVQCKLQSGTNKAVDWLMANRLHVNNEKSTCMLIGTRQRLSDLSINICISGKSLENCTYTKLLGVYIDCHLTWDKHIEVMQVTSQALVRWRLIHFGRKEEVLRNTYLIILSLILWYYNLLDLIIKISLP